MPRIKNPPKYADKSALFKKMKTKIDGEGVAGPAVAFMAAQNIVLADDLAEVVLADANEVDRLSFDAVAIVAHKKADLLFNPPWKIVTKGAQYLKLSFEPNMDLLIDWSIPVEGGTKIEYPSDFIERTDILFGFYVKNGTYPPATTPLHGYIVQNSIIPADEVLATTNAVAQHDIYTTNSADSVTQTNSRKVNFRTPWKHVLKLQNFYMEYNAANPFLNRGYGFNVVDGKIKAKETKSSLLPLYHRKYTGVVVGKEVLNDSTGPINLQQGTKATAKIIVIPPGGSYVVLKGGTTIIITNPSATLTAKFRLTKTK